MPNKSDRKKDAYSKAEIRDRRLTNVTSQKAYWRTENKEIGAPSSSRKISYDWLTKQWAKQNKKWHDAENNRAATHREPIRKEASESCYLTEPKSSR